MKLDMINIPEGDFLMGADLSDPGAELEDGPLRKVRLSPFAIQKTPISVGQWRAFLADFGYSWDGHRELENDRLGKDQAVAHVNWFDASEFSKWLSGKTGRPYTLPTEAQWERACRGTAGQLYPWGNQELEWLDEMALNPEQSKRVGARVDLPSACGCLDMWLNVGEWCSDWYSDELCEMAPEELEYLDPKGPTQGSYRVVRGGNALFKGWPLCSRRGFQKPEFRSALIGFRIVENGLDGP